MGSVTPHLPAAVVVRGLHVRFGSVDAVNGVDLEAQAGQATALLGRNGAGKSTTMRVLAGVVPPTSGTVLVAGLDVRQDPMGVKRRVGGTLRECRVAVLGLAFKSDTDDERDSLSHKLIRLLERELADVAVHDPVVATPTSSFDEAVTGADVIIVATNHSAYSTPASLRTIAELAPDALLVDPWNALGTAQVFAYVAEVAALRA